MRGYGLQWLQLVDCALEQLVVCFLLNLALQRTLLLVLLLL